MDDGLYRSAQMYGGHTAPLAARHGIACVVNLRGANPDSTWYGPERAACAALGIVHLDRPLHSRRLPEAAALAALLEAYDTAPRPVLAKCSGGADRAGLASALWLLHRGGADALAAARRQLAFLPHLHLPRRHQRWIRRLPEFYAADAAGAPLAAWIDARYRPDRFAAWLESRGLDGTWRR